MPAAEGPAGITQDRPSAARRMAGWLPLALVGWLMTYGVLLFAFRNAIAKVEFRDPDDELRLQQVRDLLAGQGWFDLHQYRIDAADGGVLMHWSRLVDAPIAALIALLRPLLGQAQAELVAAIAIPALTLFCIIALVAWMASRTMAFGGRLMAVIALCLCAPVIMQVLPLRIDHHGWQIVLALAAVAAFLDRDERRGGWLSGAALAAWMAISFEGLPLSAWFVAVLACWTLVDMTMRVRLLATMQSLAACSLVLFLATRGIGDLAAHCDAIAPVHLAMFAWGALAISVAAMARPQSRLWLAAGLGLAAAGALGLLVAVAPRCTTGTFDMLDPVVRSYWYDNVLEGKPLWKAGPVQFVQYALPTLIGLWSAFTLARRSDGPLRRWWLFYALVLTGALALSLLVLRSAAVSGALAALPLGWRLASWMGGLRRPDNPLLRVGELAGVAVLIFVALFPAVPAVAVKSMVSADAEDSEAGQGADAFGIACSTAGARAAIAALPPGDILAGLDFGPNILANSDRGVLATGHHRAGSAMRAVIDAFTGSPERARAIMGRYRLRYVVICPDVQEMDLFRKRAPDGFAAQMTGGTVPDWLELVPLPEVSGLNMWRLTD